MTGNDLEHVAESELRTAAALRPDRDVKIHQLKLNGEVDAITSAGMYYLDPYTATWPLFYKERS